MYGNRAEKKKKPGARLTRFTPPTRFPPRLCHAPVRVATVQCEHQTRVAFRCERGTRRQDEEAAGSRRFLQRILVKQTKPTRSSGHERGTVKTRSNTALQDHEQINLHRSVIKAQICFSLLKGTTVRAADGAETFLMRPHKEVLERLASVCCSIFLLDDGSGHLRGLRAFVVSPNMLVPPQLAAFEGVDEVQQGSTVQLAEDQELQGPNSTSGLHSHPGLAPASLSAIKPGGFLDTTSSSILTNQSSAFLSEGGALKRRGGEASSQQN